MIVLIDYLHDKGNECFDEDLAALCEVAPLFEQIHQLLTKVTLTVIVSEELKKLWCNLR